MDFKLLSCPLARQAKQPSQARTNVDYVYDLPSSCCRNEIIVPLLVRSVVLPGRIIRYDTIRYERTVTNTTPRADTGAVALRCAMALRASRSMPTEARSRHQRHQSKIIVRCDPGYGEPTCSGSIRGSRSWSSPTRPVPPSSTGSGAAAGRHRRRDQPHPCLPHPSPLAWPEWTWMAGLKLWSAGHTTPHAVAFSPGWGGLEQQRDWWARAGDRAGRGASRGRGAKAQET